jgi:hypothetical protein
VTQARQRSEEREEKGEPERSLSPPTPPRARTMEALTKSFQSFEKGVTKQMGKMSKAATRAATATPGTGVLGSKPFKSIAQWNKLTPTEKDKIAKQYGIEGLKRKDQKSFFERMF